jgi:hypothetical protein
MDKPSPDRSPVLLDLENIDARLTRIEALLSSLVANKIIKDYYSVAEVAELVDRSAFQVREWLRGGRMIGRRTESGRGRHAEWRVSHDELTHYRNHGLRPGKSVGGATK